eukprot:TRINITY_DN9276_c1_g1_i1.p1 TRINITY_DN9276_c1_g1~~TRINITY_DN9276_c1_g1_i1.p1  ORF type:complete len:531 (+),score=128.96 TRINITY_DN9276_c1_g1_i1:88-1680(+)
MAYAAAPTPTTAWRDEDTAVEDVVEMSMTGATKDDVSKMSMLEIPKAEKASAQLSDNESATPVSPKPPNSRPPVFDVNDVERTKQKALEALRKPEPYSVFMYYKTSGVWQFLAKHSLFENFTLFVIAVNALWMAIDTDLNDSDVLLKAHIVFIIAENFFCTYFFLEWVIRFMAFKHKTDCRKDAWFVFDSLLVFMMVMETWVFVAIAGDGPSPLGNAAILRLFRLLRLSRLMRMLRSLPELMILIKGMASAMRSVVYVMALLLIITYVFAIACTQISEGTEFKKDLFANVALSMYSLMVYATFLDDLSDFCNAIRAESFFTLCVIGVFICLSALTVMNMLVGVLCEVISDVASAEREGMRVDRVETQMLGLLSELDENGSGSISIEEFSKILESAQALRTLEAVDVDPVGLVDFAEMFFAPDGVPIELDFNKFMELVLDLRQTNVATVKDLMNLNRQTTKKLERANLYAERVRDRTHEIENDIVDVKESVNRIEHQLATAISEVHKFAADCSDTIRSNSRRHGKWKSSLT